jgi:hypothetical protein
MKPYIILFENGVKSVQLKKSIEQVKIDSGNFAKFGTIINGVHSCCHNMAYTTRPATKEEIQKKLDWIKQVEEEYQEVCEQNAKVDRYNSALARATNHNEFMNAANHLL